MAKIKLSKIKRRLKGFSLIELSIVVLIIGLIIASVMGGSKLIELSTLSRARALTNSSPVNGTEDLVFWSETVSKDSFSAGQSDGSEVLTWHDLNPQNTVKNDATGVTTTVPLYTKNAINGLPALRFDGVDDFLLPSNISLANTNFTIFLVGKVNGSFADDTLMPMIGRSSGGNDSVKLGWWMPNYFVQYISSLGANTSSGFAANPSKPTIITFRHSSTSGVGVVAHANGETIYSIPFNGTTNFRVSPNLGVVAIGRETTAYFSGDIGEVIIFTRSLSDFEITQIEQYLSKKWGIKLV